MGAEVRLVGSRKKEMTWDGREGEREGGRTGKISLEVSKKAKIT